VSIWSILALALGVAMDAAAVAAVRGLSTPRVSARAAVRVALYFGGFQAVMPALGWLLGKSVGPWIQQWDHWVAFGLLAALGVHLLIEARKPADVRAASEAELFGNRVLLGLAFATSVDAFVVGIPLASLDAPLAASLSIIGATTAVLSVAALYAGRRLGLALGGRLDAFGGWMLIALGAKILLQHLGAAP
jgi:putative Mn2+ efflux pump MntP